MFKKKIFIFDELNYLFLPIAIFQKVIKRDVYFLRLSKLLQNKKSIKFLENLGFKWFNYQDYEIVRTAEITRDVVSLQKKLSNSINDSHIANDLKNKLLKMGCTSSDLQSFVLTRSAFYIRNFCEIVTFINYTKKNHGNNDIIIIGQFPSFLKKTFISEIGSKNSLLNFYYFTALFLILKLILNKIKFKIKRIFLKKKNIQNINKKVNLEKFNTIFFPHQGIFYGNIYKKDHFYSKNNNSNFYPSKILHLSIGDSISNNDLTKNFYNENKITNIDFISLGGVSFKNILSYSLNFLLKYFFSGKNKLGETLFFLLLWLSIKRSLNRLNSLPNAKVAIFGNDLNSPRDLSIACRIKGIKTIATQDSFINAWGEDAFLILDHYLVINNKVEKHIISSQLNSIKTIKPIGAIRSDLISMFKNEEKNNSEKIVLILDTRSSKGFYKNGRAFSSSWRLNFGFYKNILQLAKKYQDIKFIIKGKNYDFIDIPYFKDIKRSIDQAPNVELYDNKKNSFNELLGKTVLTIATYTSLIDELLSKERPVIIYDTTGYPSTFFNYGHNLIVKNYEELQLKFDIWKKDSKKFNKSIIDESSKHFPINKSENKVYDLLHEYLEHEFEYYI